MPSTSISPRYRITLPKDIREDLDLQIGDEISFLRKGDEIIIVKVPKDPLKKMAGIVHTDEDVKGILKKLKEEELMTEDE